MWRLSIERPSQTTANYQASSRLSHSTPQGVAAVSFPPVQTSPVPILAPRQDTVRPQHRPQVQVSWESNQSSRRGGGDELSREELSSAALSIPTTRNASQETSRSFVDAEQEGPSTSTPSLEGWIRDASTGLDGPHPQERPIRGLETKYNIRMYITRCICNCRSFAELHSLIHAYMDRFDGIHVAAAYSKLAKLASPLPAGVGPGAPVSLSPPQLSAQQHALLHSLNKLSERLRLVLPLYWSAREMSNCAWAMGKLQYCPEQQLLAAMVHHLEAPDRQRLQGSGPQELAMLVYGLAKLRYSRPSKVWYLVSQLSQRQLLSFKPQEICMLLWAYATCRQRDTPLFATVADEAMRRMPDFSPQGLSMLIWSYARMSHHDYRLFGALAAEFTRKLPDASPQSLANTAWAFARAYHHHPVLFAQLTQAALANLHAFGLQELSVLLWACATAGHKDEPFVHAAIEYARPRLRFFRVEQLIWLLWACARLRVTPAPGFVVAASSCMLPLMSSCTAQHLAMLAQALARSPDCDHSLLLTAMAQRARACMVDFTPQGLAVLAWGLSVARHHDLELFAQLTKAASTQLSGLKPVELANLLWAVTRAGHRDPALFTAAMPLVQASARRFLPASVVQVAWAFAAQAQYNEAMFNTLARLGNRYVSELAPGQLAQLLWAVAHVGHSYQPLYATAAQKLLGKLGSQGTRTLVTLTLAFSKAAHPSTALYEALATELAARSQHLHTVELERLGKALTNAGHPLLAQWLRGRGEQQEQMQAADMQGSSHEGMASQAGGSVARHSGAARRLWEDDASMQVQQLQQASMQVEPQQRASSQAEQPQRASSQAEQLQQASTVHVEQRQRSSTVQVLAGQDSTRCSSQELVENGATSVSVQLPCTGSSELGVDSANTGTGSTQLGVDSQCTGTGSSERGVDRTGIASAATRPKRRASGSQHGVERHDAGPLHWAAGPGSEGPAEPPSPRPPHTAPGRQRVPRHSAATGEQAGSRGEVGGPQVGWAMQGSAGAAGGTHEPSVSKGGGMCDEGVERGQVGGREGGLLRAGIGGRTAHIEQFVPQLQSQRGSTCMA